MSSKILDFIFGYERSDEKFAESRIGNMGKRFFEKNVGGFGNSYVKQLTKNPSIKFI